MFMYVFFFLSFFPQYRNGAIIDIVRDSEDRFKVSVVYKSISIFVFSARVCVCVCVDESDVSVSACELNGI